MVILLSFTFMNIEFVSKW